MTLACSAIDTHQYASLVAALYRGPFQQSPWQDFLRELQAAFPPCIPVIGLRLPSPGDTGISFVGGVEISLQDRQNYANKFKALDPLVNLPDVTVVALDDLISRSALKRTTYYQTFMKPFNQEQLIGFDIQRDEQVALFLRLIRGHREATFAGRDRAFLELLIPQFRELAKWMEKSRSHLREHSLFEQAFSNLAMATVILDADMNIVHINNIAEQLLGENNGVICVAGKLRLISREGNLHLQESLQSILASEQDTIPHVISMPRKSQPHPLLMTLKKLPLGDGVENAHHVAVYMTAVEMRHFDKAQLLVEAFGLTPQEIRLVIALVNGRTMDDFVEEMGIRKNTARSHLYSAFRKVGVSQQSSLVSHVLRVIYGL